VAFVVSAHWRALPGEEDRIARIIEEMTPLSRAEPGCLYYQAHRSPDDEQLFYLYEQYVDESGYEAHIGSEHFTRLVKEEAIPNLESRDRAFFKTMG
jgi:quinol monooxygenase YgiN